MTFTICIACVAFAFGWYCSQWWRRRFYRRKLETLLNEPHPFEVPEDEHRRQER
jgi:hypothetical protein